MPSPRAIFRLRLLLALLALGASVRLTAENTIKIQPLDKVTVAVTDLTAAGRELPIPSPAQPVYYIGINAGLRTYAGSGIAGDPPPEPKTMLRIIAQALRDQGFFGADTQHPATQIIVCSWGVLGSSGHNLLGPGAGIHFLGGEKMPFVLEDDTIPGHLSPDVLRRNFRSGAADVVLGMSHETLYAVLLRAYDLKAAEAGKRVQLWETRIACASPGATLANALPRIVVSGKHVIGRETEQPVVANVARTRQAWVEIGESTVVDYIDLADLAKAKEAARAHPPGSTATPSTEAPPTPASGSPAPAK